MSTTEPAPTEHFVMREAGIDDDPLARATGELQRKFGIKHATLQTETAAPACQLAPDEVI